jgi:hypothetical protein
MMFCHPPAIPAFWSRHLMRQSPEGKPFAGDPPMAAA